MCGEAKPSQATRGRNMNLKGVNVESLSRPKSSQSLLNFKCQKPIRLKCNDSVPPKPSVKSAQKPRRSARQKKLIEEGPSQDFPARGKPSSPSARVKNRGVALSVKDVRHKVNQLLRCSKDSSSLSEKTADPHHPQNADHNRTPDPRTPRTEDCGTKSTKAARTPKAVDFKLPEKYAMLGEFFDCMESAIRLLRLRKTMCSFRNICPQVETMSHRRFMHSHVAQMKYILPESIQLEKILSHDEKSLCMKPDLKITLLHNALPTEKGTVTASNVNSAVLRKTFHTRLLEFVKAHPEGDDVPEDILPEPFNRKAWPLPSVVSVESNSVSRADTTASTVPVEQTDPRPSVIASLLPQGFQRRFSQRNHLAQASPLPSRVSDQPLNINSSEGPDILARSDGSGGLCSNSGDLHPSPDSESHFAAKYFPPEISRESMELKECNGLQGTSASNIVHHVSSMFKPRFSAKACRSDESPFKAPAAKPIPSEDAVDTGIGCKTSSSSQNPCSAASSPYHSCERVRKDYFSPATPRFSPDSSNSEAPPAVSAYYKTPVVESVVKSQIKTPVIKKSLSFENAPSTVEALTKVLSPGTPDFVTPIPSVVTPNTSMPRSKNSRVRKAIAFNRSSEISDITSFKTNLSPYRGRTPGALKRKTAESNLDDKWCDDFECPQSPMRSTIAANPVTMNSNEDSIKATPSRAPANPFGKNKESNRVMPIHSYSIQSPVKAIGLQEIQNEGTPIKVLPATPHLHTPKRARRNAGERHSTEKTTAHCISQTSKSSFLSPRENNKEPCELDVDIIASEQHHPEAQDTKVEEACNNLGDVMSQSDLEIIRSIPASVVQSIQERERKAVEDCLLGVSAAKRRQQMIASLPKLFRAIRFVFHSEKRSVFTHEELVHKLIANKSDIIDRSEVVEQLHLLEELAPDWISFKRASSGDLLYRIENNADLQDVNMRIARAS